MTATNTLGIRNGNQIVAYGQTTRQTKVITNATSSDIVLAFSGLSGQTLDLAQIMAYRDSGSNWRLRFNFRIAVTGGGSARTSATITFQGAYAVVFPAKAQAVSAVEVSNATPATAQTGVSDGVVTIYHASYASNGYEISGDVALASEPTWAAANMEGAVNASVYIPPASATETGLVSTAAQTIAGVKTFSAMPALATNTPATAGAAGITGQIAWDASYIYVCVATNSWKRAGIAAGW